MPGNAPKTHILNHLKKLMKKCLLFWKLYDMYLFLHNRCYLCKYTGSPIPHQQRYSPEPSFERITSQLATSAQCFEPRYIAWCEAMRSPARIKRKQWESVYILEALRRHERIGEGSCGLGFGCGLEPLPAILAKKGCSIVATDIDLIRAEKQGWVDTRQHAASLANLNFFHLCPDDLFYRRVSFRVVDMNAIPSGLTGFDFLWSSCALEHLGSLEHGLGVCRTLSMYFL
jgi:hypothetical protein